MSDRLTPVETFESRFETLFRDRFASLHRYLAGVTGDGMLADDLAQESFMKLYLRGELPDNPGGWLVAVSHNLLRDGHRRTSRQLRLLASNHGPADQETPVDAGAEAQVLRAERVGLVQAVLQRLPVRDQQLLLLRHEGFSYQDISEALGIRATSVGTLLARATRVFTDAYRGVPDASN